MLTEILNELKSDGISVTNSKRTLKKSGQKEVYYIIVDNVEYILKIINVTPYAIYDEYDYDDPELPTAIKNGVLLLSQRTIKEIEMAKKCPILPQMKLMEKLRLKKINDEYYIYYIEEKIEGETLKYKKNYTLMEINDFLLQMVDNIIVMNEKHYIHRDIKPDNIIYNKDKNTYSLIDGGICKNTEDEIKLTVTNKPLGTPRYMAPEQMKVAPNEVWNFQTDLYPLGLIAIEMFVPNIRSESNPELRDLHFVITEWEKQCKSENDLTYFKKIIVNLSNETRALRFNNLEKLKNELLHWKEVLK